jgi:hypothetical protein
VTTLTESPRASYADARPYAAAIPWYLWCAAASITSIAVGLYWDISWHISIGRDTFWTPAHLAIHLGGVLAAVSCGYRIAVCTLSRDASARESSVGIWGLRGPLGAFVASWGGFTMLTSAPFDDWWHNAYGLDVKIVSPPHVVLLTGMLTVGFGSLLLILGHVNRTAGEERRKADLLLLYVGAMLLSITAMFITEYVDRTAMHDAGFYRTVAIAIPIVLMGVETTSGHRLACSLVTAWYTVLWIAALWIFPLFPATAKLGPVLTPVTHMVPLSFPLLILPPALALDWLRGRWGSWRSWRKAVVGGALFLVVFAAVQWPFGDFLMMPQARNWIFGTHYFSYMDDPADYASTYRFVETAPATALAKGAAVAFVASIVSTGLGLLWGSGLKRVQR